MNNLQSTPTFEQLQESLKTAINHPSETGWSIYRYLKGNIETISSTEARTLLATYTKMNMTAPSMLHSCMLTMALKMMEKFADFRLPSFLKIWGYPENLRDEDKQKQVGKDGKCYLSLQEHTERCLQSYILHHQTTSDIVADVPIRTMMAVKVFVTEKNGRKLKSVKLVGTDGQEMIAEQHQFPCKPWEIVGRMFDVLQRTSKNDNVRVQEMVVSQKQIGDMFPLITGYVDKFDAQHNHYHIFDNTSRHFVAESPKERLQVGDFVEFAPIVPAQDKFKSAVVTRILPAETGIKTFGIYDATITYVNKENGYFYYKITSEIKQTTEGEITIEGSTQLSLMPETVSDAKVGTPIRIIMFLKRGKDGKKHNYVAKIL